MRAVFVINIKKHFDYSDKHIIFAVFNLNISIMTFTILRSPKTHRCYIYNKDGFKLAQCATMNDVFDYFYSWCEALSCKSVIYTQTADKNVIRVMLD